MEISNREKAQEITNKHQNEWIFEFIESNNLSKEDRNQLRFKLYDACNEMAEWKDEQFSIEKEKLIKKCNEAVNKSHEHGAVWMKERLIEKAVEWLKNNIGDYYVTCEFEQWFDDMYEDLKEAMKKI